MHATIYVKGNHIYVNTCHSVLGRSQLRSPWDRSIVIFDVCPELSLAVLAAAVEHTI